MTTAPVDQSETDIPLCVDLDGTLLRTDTLIESLVALFKLDISAMFWAPLWLLQGRAGFKAQVAHRAALDVSTLPGNDAFLEWLTEQHAAGRRLILCTAANVDVAQKIADRFGIFDSIMASTESVNLGGRAKARHLVEVFGEGGFDYAGNESRDVHVWKVARHAIVVNPDARLQRKLSAMPRVEQSFIGDHESIGAWLRAMRLHQWSKNALIFLPALASHRIVEIEIFVASLIAFVVFSLCASGTYMLNDLMDLASDRGHPTKKNRPFANGELPLVKGLIIAGALISASVIGSFMILGGLFAGSLLLYLGSTIWYSTVLKRIAMVDALTLAGLYTIRVLAGDAATSIAPSFWLLAFSVFVFLSLAMAKRYAELMLMRAGGQSSTSGRGYTVNDLPLLQSCGISSGYIGVLVLALYVNTGAELLYERPEVIWLLCPLLLYWISRVWIKTHRGEMHDDPVVFALTDKPSLLTFGMAGVVIAMALQSA
jgi:4-hydroxybenzoate polyprenyltransferase/phosphoserine phosphatase